MVPSTVTAWTLPTTTSGVAPNLICSAALSSFSASWCPTETYACDSSMAAARPDRRRVSLAAVKMLWSAGQQVEHYLAGGLGGIHDVHRVATLFCSPARDRYVDDWR